MSFVRFDRCNRYYCDLQCIYEYGFGRIERLDGECNEHIHSDEVSKA